MGLKLGSCSCTTLLLFSLAGILSAAAKLRLVTSTFGPYSFAAKTDGAQQIIEAYSAGDGSLALATASSADLLCARISNTVLIAIE